jgi:hypothetical protein
VPVAARDAALDRLREKALTSHDFVRDQKLVEMPLA